MRFFLYLNAFFLLATVVLAWTKEDHEIFDLVGALEAAEGKGTTFYSWLDVAPSASLAEINKAYRKKSMQLHPDKNPGVKGIQERFSRLGVIANILRSPERRERYDFFYKNGVPKWRGTGYYYTRFRPGLGTVLVFLTILTTGLQYVVQTINYRRDLARIGRTMHDARLAAWGPKMTPLEGKRKVKVNLGGGPRLDDSGNLAAGRMIDMVVDGDKVHILDPSEGLIPLNEGSATPAALSRTWLVALLRGAVMKVQKKGKATESECESDDGLDAAASGASVGQQGGHTAVENAGGRRRKTVRKR
ncbi:DnaJ-domain-containing protein [Phlebopus sp. FC_14]|nr:DnaJ-domain-containing protein [Phlebopus sp. FC_14]